MDLQIIRNPFRRFRTPVTLGCLAGALACIGAFLADREQVLYPSPGITGIWAYADADDTARGTSTIHLDTIGTALRCTLTLGSGIDDPYAGISIIPLDSVGGFLDFAGWDNIVIDCSIKGTRGMQVEYTTFVDNFTDRAVPNTARYHISEIDNIEGRNHISLPLKGMETPSWWYAQNGLDKARVADANLRHVLWLGLGSGPLTRKGSPVSCEIRKVALTRNHPFLLAGAGLFLALGCLLFLASLRPERAIPLTIRPIKMGNHADEETLRLLSWLGEHYDEAELNLSRAARETGLSTARLTELLDRHCRLSFKQYLTRIRLAEGARLLQDTDRQVTEIAIAVGYQYPTSFNRTFREEYGCSPTDYRKGIAASRKD